MPDMAEPAPCRWGAMSVLMRIKNKITKIREKLWMSEILNDVDFLDSSGFPDSQHFDNEASTSNRPDFQQPYFDAPQVFQNPTLPQYTTLDQSGDLFSQMMLDSVEGSGTSHGEDDLFTLADFGIENQQQPWTTHQMDHTGLVYSTSQPVYTQYGCAEEFMDAETEMQDEQSSLQHCYSAPQLGHHLSTVEKVEMIDGGDSSNLGQVRQSSAAEWQQIMFLERFLGVDRVVQGGPGWRVVLRIVSAFKRISGLIRRKRQQQTPEDQTALNTPRRIRAAELRYKGIRQRNGKWVSEIRIGGTMEKVWLGSYNTEKEAALAFDAGKYHCSLKRAKGFNFSDSPRLLGAPQNFSHLSSIDRRIAIQRLAEDHARAYGSTDIR